MTSAPTAVPDKARENLDTLRQFEEAHEREASRIRRSIEAASLFFGSPTYFVCVAAFAVAWIAVDAWGTAHGWLHM